MNLDSPRYYGCPRKVPIRSASLHIWIQSFFFLHSLLPKSLAMSLLCNTAFAVQLSSSSLPDFLCPFACPFQLFAFLPCPFCSGCLSCACLLLKHLLVFIIDTVNLCFYLNFLPLSHASGFYYKPLWGPQYHNEYTPYMKNSLSNYWCKHYTFVNIKWHYT